MKCKNIILTASTSLFKIHTNETKIDSEIRYFITAINLKKLEHYLLAETEMINFKTQKICKVNGALDKKTELY